MLVDLRPGLSTVSADAQQEVFGWCFDVVVVLFAKVCSSRPRSAAHTSTDAAAAAAGLVGSVVADGAADVAGDAVAAAADTVVAGDVAVQHMS